MLPLPLTHSTVAAVLLCHPRALSQLFLCTLQSPLLLSRRRCLLLSSSPTVSAAVNRHARRLLLSPSSAEEREINPLCDYHCFLAYYLLVSVISILLIEFFVPHFELNASRSLS